MMLLPAREGTCPICAVDHKPDDPHNAQSLYYQYRFFGVRGRWPTWADAVAHCTPEKQAGWKRLLSEGGHWTEPEDGQPIADPPEESVRQAIGDISSTVFGPDAPQGLKDLT